MKKIFSVLLAVLLVATLSVSALAAVDSKTLLTAPADGYVVDTPEVKEAASEILNADPADLVDTNNATYAAIAEDVLAATDADGNAFQSVESISVFTLDPNKDPEPIKAKDNFVGLYKKNADGVWERVNVQVVDGVVVNEDGTPFVPEEGVVYAIVYGSTWAPASPKTGESVPYGFLIAALVLAGGAVVFFRKSRKANA